MKNIYLLIGIIILGVLMLPGILALGIRLVPSGFQPSLDFTQKVYKEVSIVQTFTATSNQLSGIGVSIKNPNLINKENIFLSLYQGDVLLRQVTLNGRSIDDGNFVKFIFSPISDSKGGDYRAVFTAPDPTSGEALEIFLTKNVIGEPVVVGQEKRLERLSDVIFYRPANLFAVSLDIYGGWLRKFTADLPFAGFYILSFVLGLGYLTKDYILKKN